MNFVEEIRPLGLASQGERVRQGPGLCLEILAPFGPKMKLRKPSFTEFFFIQIPWNE